MGFSHYPAGQGLEFRENPVTLASKNKDQEAELKSWSPGTAARATALKVWPHGPASSASLWILLEMQIWGPHLRLLNLKFRVELSNLCFIQSSRGLWCALKSENDWQLWS